MHKNSYFVYLATLAVHCSLQYDKIKYTTIMYWLLLYILVAVHLIIVSDGSRDVRSESPDISGGSVDTMGISQEGIRRDSVGIRLRGHSHKSAIALHHLSSTLQSESTPATWRIEPRRQRDRRHGSDTIKGEGGGGKAEKEVAQLMTRKGGGIRGGMAAALSNSDVRGDVLVNFPITFVTPAAYLGLRLELDITYSLYFLLKTTSSEGLIFYAHADDGPCFVSVELWRGLIRYAFDLNGECGGAGGKGAGGGGEGTIGGGAYRVMESRLPINDNRWHGVTVTRLTLSRHLLRVDDAATFEIVGSAWPENSRPGGGGGGDISMSSRRSAFDLGAYLYVSGLPGSMFAGLPEGVKSSDGFKGCMASVDLDGHGLTLADRRVELTEDHRELVRQGCEGTHQQGRECTEVSCDNGGICEQTSTSYTCDCSMTSFTGPTCADDSIAYTFGRSGGLITFTVRPSDRASTRSDRLTVGFLTTRSDAVIARVSSESSTDFLELKLVNGYVQAEFSLGQTVYSIAETFEQVDDGNYHVIRVTRNGPNSTLKVDNMSLQTRSPPVGTQMMMFNALSSIDIGGKRGLLNEPKELFYGTLAGLVFNDLSLLELAAEGDPRIKVKGDVQLEIKPLRPHHEATNHANGMRSGAYFGVESGGSLDQYLSSNKKMRYAADDLIMTSIKVKSYDDCFVSDCDTSTIVTDAFIQPATHRYDFNGFKTKMPPSETAADLKTDSNHESLDSTTPLLLATISPSSSTPSLAESFSSTFSSVICAQDDPTCYGTVPGFSAGIAQNRTLTSHSIFSPTTGITVIRPTQRIPTNTTNEGTRGGNRGGTRGRQSTSTQRRSTQVLQTRRAAANTLPDIELLRTNKPTQKENVRETAESDIKDGDVDDDDLENGYDDHGDSKGNRTFSTIRANNYWYWPKPTALTISSKPRPNAARESISPMEFSEESENSDDDDVNVDDDDLDEDEMQEGEGVLEVIVTAPTPAVINAFSTAFSVTGRSSLGANLALAGGVVLGTILFAAITLYALFRCRKGGRLNCRTPDCGSKLVPSAQHQLLLTGENGGKGRGESTLNASAAYKYASCGSRPPVFSPMPGAVDKDSVLQACQKVVYVPDNSTITSQLAPSSSSLLCNKKYVNEWYV